jgi:hypothetical protein
MGERFSCAVASLAAGEPCYGTASRARRWILVEQPGPWGRDAVLDSRLPGDVGVRLRALAREARARLVLIRRVGRSDPDVRSAFAVVTTPELRRIERVTFADPLELLDVPWARLRGFAPVDGEVVDAPLYLVCTNGAHDACCAVFGRPLAEALVAEHPDAVWEVSHIGGDRFAGNLVCLPEGVYYGRVEPGEAVKLLAEHRAGRIDLSRYRGRSYLDFPVQAAESLVRERLDLLGLDDLAVARSEELDPGTHRVTFALPPDGLVTAVVRCSPGLDPQQLTCRSTSEEHPPRYELVDLQR